MATVVLDGFASAASDLSSLFRDAFAEGGVLDLTDTGNATAANLTYLAAGSRLSAIRLRKVATGQKADLSHAFEGAANLSDVDWTDVATSDGARAESAFADASTDVRAVSVQ